MKIYYSSYELTPRTNLSSAKPRQGALLMVELSNGSCGFSDLHPWPEFAQAPLSEQLRFLKNPSWQKQPISAKFLIARRSIHWAHIDAQFRQNKQNAFIGLAVPKNHFLLSDIESLGPDQVLAIEESGFKAIKIKVGRNVDAELKAFSRLEEQHVENLLFRFDFNENLTIKGFNDYWLRLPKSIRERVEFVEDPFVFEPKQWANLQTTAKIRLALDRAGHDLGNVKSAKENRSADFLVVKPCDQNESAAVELFFSPQEQIKTGFVDRQSLLVVTSSLGHPIGQMASAFAAAQLSAQHPGRVAECGLLSHTTYLPNAFSECLVARGPELVPSVGLGFGFDDLLMQQSWRAL